MALGLLGACAASDDLRPEETASFASDTVHLTEVAAAYRPNILDTVALGFPKALHISGDTVVVVDRDELLTVFDLDLTFQARWSRRGEGPGELLNPLDIERHGSEWIVADAGNGRIQRFDQSGTATSSQTTQARLRQIAAVPDGIVVLGRTATYLALLDSTGAPAPWGPRMSPRDTSRIERAAVAVQKHFVADFSGGVVILDGETADIFVLREDGSTVQRWSLPNSVRDKMFAETGVDEDDVFPEAVFAYRPGFNTMAVSPDGAWLVAIPGGSNPFGAGPLFVDLSTGTWYPSRVSISDVAWRPPRVVFGLAFDGRNLFLINSPQDGSILRVPVRLPPSE